MKIVHVMPWYMPGHSYQENHLPHGQVRLGHDVTILTSIWPAGKFRLRSVAAREVGSEDGVSVVRLGTWFWLPRRGQLLLKGVTRRLRALQADVVHAHGVWSLPTLQVTLLRKPSPRVFVDDHADGWNFRFEKIDRRILRWVFRSFFLPYMRNHIDKFISVNPFSEFHLKAHFGIPDHRIVSLPLGVDARGYVQDSIAREEVRRQLRLPMNAIVFFTAGTLDLSKGLECLIRAFGGLARQRSDTWLSILGSGPPDYLRSLHDLASETQAVDRIVFCGWVHSKDLSRYYNAGDVAIMPGKISTIKDALAVGVPIVVTDDLASSFLVSNDNGFTFRSGDHEQLKEIMSRYAGDQNLRIEHGKRSMELVKRNLSWDRIAERSIEIYLAQKLNDGSSVLTRTS